MSSHYNIPPKDWIVLGGGIARSRHRKSSHAWHKRQANRLARRAGKAFTREAFDA